MSTNVPHALRCTPPAASHTHHLSFIVLNNTLDPGAAGVTTLAAEPCILLAGTPCGSKQPRHHTCAVSQHATRAARHRNTTYAHHVPTAHQRPSNCGPPEVLGASPRTGGLQSQGQHNAQQTATARAAHMHGYGPYTAREIHTQDPTCCAHVLTLPQHKI